MFESIENLENTRGMTIQAWVQMPGTKNEIFNRFRHFLKTYEDFKGNKIYEERILRMCERKLLTGMIDNFMKRHSLTHLNYGCRKQVQPGS